MNPDLKGSATRVSTLLGGGPPCLCWSQGVATGFWWRQSLSETKTLEAEGGPLSWMIQRCGRLRKHTGDPDETLSLDWIPELTPDGDLKPPESHRMFKCADERYSHVCIGNVYHTKMRLSPLQG